MTTRHPRGSHHPRLRGSAEGPASSDGLAESSLRWVRVTCPSCGAVRVRADHVVVRKCIDDRSWSYRARCSQCDTMFVGTTPEALALPALAAGLAIELWRLPQPSGRRPGAPMQAVDALELHFALLEPDWFDRWTGVEPRDDR